MNYSIAYQAEFRQYKTNKSLQVEQNVKGTVQKTSLK